jgi:hypothetical protein
VRVAVSLEDDAEDLLRKRLAKIEQEEGGESYGAAVAAHELGVLLADLGKVDEAAALYHRSVRIKRSVLGLGHPEIAATLHNWALLANASGNVDQARSLWAEAEAVLNQSTKAARDD